MEEDIVIFAPHHTMRFSGAYEIIRQQPEYSYVVFMQW